MDQKYWDDISHSYEEEIFDVLKNDKKGIIKSWILELSSPEKVVTDIGCAVGKWLPLLSSAFRTVNAIDLSEQHIKYAQSKYGDKSNINFLAADFTKPIRKIKPCDVALCVNAILVNSDKKRMAFFKGIANCLKRKGHLILVVPSLESALYSEFMGNHWNTREGIQSNPRPVAEASRRYHDLKKGIIELDNIPTKHYLEEELVITLQNEGFQITRTEKVEYSWNTEFDNPPAWMKAPFPWDWLVVAQKV